MPATTTMDGVPKFLQRVARKNMIGKRFADAQARFSLAFAKELSELEHDPLACVFCLSTRGACFRWSQDPDCECISHKECLHDARIDGESQLARCHHCISEMEKTLHVEEAEEVHVPPLLAHKRRRLIYCGTPIGMGFCQQSRGHLGHCCV